MNIFISIPDTNFQHAIGLVENETRDIVKREWCTNKRAIRQKIQTAPRRGYEQLFKILKSQLATKCTT